VDDRLEVARCLRQEVVPHDRRDVVGQLQLLVVIEQHEVVDRDGRVRREQQADVDLAALERRDRERSARVEGLEILEVDAVRALQSGRAERPGRALRRSAEDQLAPDRREVGQLRELVLVRGGLRDHEAVLVDGRRVVEDRQALGVELLLERGRGRLRVGRAGRVLVHEREERGQVVGLEVDLAAGEGREDDLPGPEVELPGDRVPVRLQHLGVQLTEDELLAEVRGADRDVRFRSTAAAAAAGARDQSSNEEHDGELRCAHEGLLPGRSAQSLGPRGQYPRLWRGRGYNAAVSTRNPGDVARRSNVLKATSTAMARSATRSAPANKRSYSCSQRPSTMYRPSPPPATSAPSVAVATTLTADVRMPASTSGKAKGISIRRRIPSSERPIPRADSMTSGSTARVPTYAFVSIGGIASGTRAMKVGQNPSPRPSAKAIGRAIPRSASEGRARPMFAIFTATNPSRP